MALLERRLLCVFPLGVGVGVGLRCCLSALGRGVTGFRETSRSIAARMASRSNTSAVVSLAPLCEVMLGGAVVAGVAAPGDGSSLSGVTPTAVAAILGVAGPDDEAPVFSGAPELDKGSESTPTLMAVERAGVAGLRLRRVRGGLVETKALAETELDGGGVKEIDGAMGLGERQVKDPSKLSINASDCPCGSVSTDRIGMSGSTLSSPTTEASSADGVRATTEVVVEDFEDTAKPLPH